MKHARAIVWFFPASILLLSCSQPPQDSAPPPPAASTNDGRPKGDGSPPPYAVVRVFYGSDRNVVTNSSRRVAYGSERAEVSYGTCEVSIPRDHRMGELESPSIWKLEFREDPEKHVVLLRISAQEKMGFFADLGAHIKASRDKKAFVFIHGYNVTFEDAARRTAQISYDLGFEGAPVFYSWPSQGTFEGYPVDETNIEWTQANLKLFLEDFLNKTDAESIYLIAHSMGNRALTRAFATLVAQEPQARKKFRELILTAPDIDAAVFKRDIAPQLLEAETSVTLYASSADKALAASKRFHGYPRAGDAGDDIVLVAGIDTIDATAVDTSFLGHSYFAESSSVLADIYHLMREGTHPSKRLGLSPVTTPSGQYWVIKK